MPDLEDVDVTEQLIEEEGTKLSITDVTETAQEPEEIPLIKPQASQEQEGIFSTNSKFVASNTFNDYYHMTLPLGVI